MNGEEQKQPGDESGLLFHNQILSSYVEVRIKRIVAANMHVPTRIQREPVAFLILRNQYKVGGKRSLSIAREFTVPDQLWVMQAELR